jgi:hypothetical protein
MWVRMQPRPGHWPRRALLLVLALVLNAAAPGGAASGAASLPVPAAAAAAQFIPAPPPSPAAGAAARPRRRHLASALPPLDASATRRAQRDAAPDPTAVPHPELYYEGDTLIWAPEDTLPRDVLARRPEVWLYCRLPATPAAAALLPHFLEHHARLGVAPDRMLFVLHRDPGGGGGEEDEGEGARRGVAALLRAFGADAREWRGADCGEGRLGAQLRALRRVPVQDWVVVAACDELLEFGGLPARLFLERREREVSRLERRLPLRRTRACCCCCC